MPMVTANGADFYYELHGKGHPLVLIAGYGCDHTFWLPILELLAASFQVLIFDNRAVGQTKDANLPLSLEVMAEDVVAICDHLKMHKPHVIGQSMGGAIAQTVAALYPEQLSKLAILTSTSKLREPVLQAFSASVKLRQNNVDVNLLIDNIAPWLFSEKYLRDKKKMELFRTAIINYPYPQTLIDQIRQCQLLQQIDIENQLKLIKAPTLIINGNEDLISLPWESKLMAQHIPNVILKELDCAHSITLEVPNELARHLLSFLT